jgi:hypothetical protein
MTKGEKWKRFFEHKGWITDDVISAGEKEKLVICVCSSEATGNSKESMINSAMILPEFDILCYETRTGTVFFQWDDIRQVRLEVDAKKRGWL